MPGTGLNTRDPLVAGEEAVPSGCYDLVVGRYTNQLLEQ